MASLPTLDEIKERLGIDPGDTSQDEDLERNLETTIAIIERYCSRGLVLADVVETQEPIATRNPKLMLYRFPVKEVTAVEVESTPGADVWAAAPGWYVLKRQGALGWGRGCFHVPHACGEAAVVRVTYSGGYDADEWPADLVDAIMRAFYYRWNDSAGSGSATEAGGPRVKSASVDGLMVTYGDASSAVSGYLSDAAIPPELVSVAPMLEPYRDRLVSGI